MTAKQAVAVVSQAAERVFATVSGVRGLVLATHRVATERADVLHEAGHRTAAAGPARAAGREPDG